MLIRQQPRDAKGQARGERGGTFDGSNGHGAGTDRCCQDYAKRNESASQNAEHQKCQRINRRLCDACRLGAGRHGRRQYRVEVDHLGEGTGLFGRDARTAMLSSATRASRPSSAFLSAALFMSSPGRGNSVLRRIPHGTVVPAIRATICTAMTFTIVIDGKIMA
jgi:hypothetical protein